MSEDAHTYQRHSGLTHFMIFYSGGGGGGRGKWTDRDVPFQLLSDTQKFNFRIKIYACYFNKENYASLIYQVKMASSLWQVAKIN